MALLKFSMHGTGVSAPTVRAAVLRIHVSAAGSGLNRFLVLGVRGALGPARQHLSLSSLQLQMGLTSSHPCNPELCKRPLAGWTDSWRQSAVSWKAHPNLAPLNTGSVVNSVASNFLRVRSRRLQRLIQALLV